VTLADDLAVVRTSSGAARVARDVVRVHGPEAVTYLQGQLSQDVAAMAVGASAPTFVLQPQGKVDVWMRATRTADDAFVLDTDAGWADSLVARLARFRLRTKVEIDRLDWSMVSVRGPSADAPAGAADHVVVAVTGRRGVPGGWDVLGADPAMPAGVPQVDAEVLEVLRIESLVPRMGAEIDETTIPAETGMVDASVSFTKGCYTGQELVARVDSRGGRAPRRVVHLVWDGAPQHAPGTPLLVDGTEVGRLTSVASDGGGGSVALGLLARSVEVPCTVDLGAGVGARVDAEGTAPAP